MVSKSFKYAVHLSPTTLPQEKQRTGIIYRRHNEFKLLGNLVPMLTMLDDEQEWWQGVSGREASRAQALSESKIS